MKKRILTILGHPAHARQSFCEVLTLAYQAGAPIAWHVVQLVSVARLKTSIPAGPSVRQCAEACLIGPFPSARSNGERARPRCRSMESIKRLRTFGNQKIG
jgi:hypothetical protein